MQTTLLYTSVEAARYLTMTRWHFSKLVKKGEILPISRKYPYRFLQEELDAYKSRQRTLAQEDMATQALANPHVFLSTRQRAICEALARHQYPSAIARDLGISRQAIHQQLARIRTKIDAAAQAARSA